MDDERGWRAVTASVARLGDQALVAALRCEDSAALREFFLRFRPGLLLAARRLGIASDERESAVEDCLADVAVHLITTAAPPPRSLPSYLARSLRNRTFNIARGRARAARRQDELSHAVEDGAVAGGSSDHAIRSSAGVPDESPALSPVLRRLAAALEAELDEDGRMLAVWLSHCVPRPEIAEWLGVALKTLDKRIERLRERLQLAALRHIERTPEDRTELLAFLGRATLAPTAADRLRLQRAASGGAG